MYIFKKNADDKKFKIKYRQLKRNFIFSFSFYNIFAILFILASIKMILVDLKIRNFGQFLWYFLIDFQSIIHTIESLLMSRLVLIHLECLVANFNIILKNKFKRNHANCQDIIVNLVQIRKLFALFNETFGQIFSIITINRFIDITYMVMF